MQFFPNPAGKRAVQNAAGGPAGSKLPVLENCCRKREESCPCRRRNPEDAAEPGESEAVSQAETGKGRLFLIEALDYLRQLNIASVLLRLSLAMLCGGLIGLERGRKRRAAGFRTYMLVCMGAALTMLLSQYEFYMLNTSWAAIAAEVGIRTDVSRFGAQVINGIGFLGAGTIIVTGQQQVKGLTTAAGLWASACMGLAIGAGFYECVAMAFLLIFLSVHVLSRIELRIVENARNMNVFVEFQSMDYIGDIINCIKSQDVQVYDVEIDHGQASKSQKPNALFTIRLNHKGSHARLLASISELPCVHMVHDI